VGRPANGGIGATGTTMENQMNGPTSAAGEQLSGNPLMGPGQIATTTGGDHQRASRGNLRPQWNR
jgi:hypothetical protein